MTTEYSTDDAPDRAWVDVDLAALVSNARRVAKTAGVPLLPMVKANGYGLGAVPVARALEAVEPWGLGVATTEEGAELRAAGISRAIVLFTPALPGWIDALRRDRIRPVICDVELLVRWLAAGPEAFHIGVDTGMSRAGFAHDDHALLAAARELLRGAEGYEGICTHFHSADADDSATEVQWKRFESAIAALGPRPPLVHAANSAAALRGSRYAADLVRPGIFLYGGLAGAIDPEPVAALRARVVAVRSVAAGQTVSYGAAWRSPYPTTIATVAAGYADGVPRALGNHGVVELHGARVPIRGRVTMDMTLVETQPEVRPGDIATLYGGVVTLDEQAATAGTVSYELLTGIGRRVERRYAGG